MDHVIVDCSVGNLKWIDGAPPPRQVFVKRGDAIDLRCSASGEPCAKYTFFKNGIGKLYRLLSNNTMFTMYSIDQVRN